MQFLEYFGHSSARPIAVGTDYVEGNDMNLFERRMAPLQFTEPYFFQKGDSGKRVLKEPLRFSEHMTDIRSDEMTGYGKRRSKETRKMEHEFSEKVKEVMDRQKRLEEEARKTNKNLRARWWHRNRDPDKLEPVKYLRYTNLKLIPESLLMTKDIVILQLTGARLGDEYMTWVGGFLQQSYTIKRLILQGNYITEEGVEHLTLGLRGSKSLMELDLSFNPIGDIGCELICNALHENAKYSRLYLLNLSTCDLSSASGFTLSRLVRDYKKLQSLLLWRNRLGIAIGEPISGAGVILSELPFSPHVQMVNMSSNGISNRDASDHATSLERTTRRATVAQLEKNMRMKHIEELRLEAEVKRGNQEAGSPRSNKRQQEERIAIHRLERQAEQEQQKIDLAIKAEERKRTYEVKMELQFRERVLEATGKEINPPTAKCRLILTGNYLTKSTFHRLNRYYAVEMIPSVEEFLERPRRYDQLVVPRRKLGEEHVLRLENEPYNYNVIPWDETFDADEEQNRRQALLDWQEEERIKDEEMVLADFNKFAMRDVRHLPQSQQKAMSGFGVGSGVNSRIKTVRDKGKADVQRTAAQQKEEERIANIRKNYGLKADGSKAGGAKPVTPSQYERGALNKARTESPARGPQITVGVKEEKPMDADASAVHHKIEERQHELRDHIKKKHDQREKEAHVAHVAPTATVATADPMLSNVVAAIQQVNKVHAEITELGMVGSPNDAQLQELAAAKKRLTDSKNQLKFALNAVPAGSLTQNLPAESPEVHELLESFLEKLVQETDSSRENKDVFNAFMDRVPLDYPRVAGGHDLVSIAAADGSVTYLTRFLSLPEHDFDYFEVTSACLFNMTHRIPLTMTMLQFLNLETVSQKVSPLLREFFADIASDKRAQPKENRGMKSMLLQHLTELPWLRLDVNEQGGDGQTVLSRALTESDSDVVDLLLTKFGTQVLVNQPLSDGSTLLIHAVVGGSYALVHQLVERFPEININAAGPQGTALEMATLLRRDPRIKAYLTDKCAAAPTGSEFSPRE